MVLAADDAVILAVPPYAAASLVRGLEVPTEFRAIVNAHFAIDPPAAQPPIVGVLNGTAQWIFAFPGRVSVTISAGDRYIDTARDVLAKTIWSEIASVTGLPAVLPNGLPPWQIVRERRATFAATPAQDARRPRAQTDGAIWRSPAIGQTPGCPPRSKGRSAPAIVPPNCSRTGCQRPTKM